MLEWGAVVMAAGAKLLLVVAVKRNIVLFHFCFSYACEKKNAS